MSKLDYIFLLSSDRSGSNLCLRLLGSHGDIIAPPTSQLIPNLYKFEAVYGDLDNPTNWRSLLENTNQLHHAGFGTWAHYADLKQLAESQKPHTNATLLRTIYEEEAKAHQRNKIAVKTHRAFEYFNQLKQDFPQAKFIHLVRDPRDMALSWMRTPALRGGIARAAEIWQHEQSGFLSICESNGSAVFRIKYEDILDRTEDALSDLCRFLGLDYDPDMLNFHNKAETRNIAGHVQAWNNLAKPLMSRNVAKYKSGLTVEQCVHVESVCGSNMAKLGYERDCNLADYDLNAISKRLETQTPWNKPEYKNLSLAERESHVVLREAVAKLAAGPNLSD